MSVLNAIILGIVQGLTEFLPVSSFGHLAILQNLFQIPRSPGVLFESLLHMGTMIAVIWVFWKDVRRIGAELFGMFLDIMGNLNLYIHNKRTGESLHYTRIVNGTYRKFSALIVVSTIPTALLGYTARRLVTKAAVSSLIPGIGLLITGILLLVTDFSKAGGSKTPREAHYDHAMWIGICQGISVFPGFSRCGLTISAALLCGFSRKFAVKYSFLMSIPATIGAFLVNVSKFRTPMMTVGLGFTYLLGMLVAAVTGYFVIQTFLRLLQKAKLRYFAFYCFLAGIAGLLGKYL
jgi:undecaprenyl-diphosphatase